MEYAAYGCFGGLDRKIIGDGFCRFRHFYI